MFMLFRRHMGKKWKSPLELSQTTSDGDRKSDVYGQRNLLYIIKGIKVQNNFT